MVRLPIKGRAGLPFKFILSISVLIALTAVTLGWFFVRHDVDLITVALMARGKSLARNLAYNLGYELQYATEQRLHELIEGVIKQEDVLYVVIQDEARRIRAQAKADQLTEIPPPTVNRSALPPPRWRDSSTQAYAVSWRGEQIYEIVQPITTQIQREREEIGFSLGGKEQTIGWAAVGMSLSLKRVNETVVGVQRTVALVTGLVIVLGIVVAVLLVKVIVRPIQQLAAATKRIAEGELGFKVEVASKDQIGDLAMSFNRMAEALQERDSDNARLFHELEATNRRLEEASRHKSEFLANVSHELRTPLTAIKGFVDNMRDGLIGPLNDRQLRYLTRIKLNTDRLARLINDLLDLSRIEAGKIDFQPTHLPLVALTQEVAESLRPMAAQKCISLEVASAESHVTAWADRDKVTQVLMNLMDNAVKFTPPQGTVSVAIRRNGADWVRIAVTDTGPGIPADEATKIFETFYQIAGAGQQKTQGTGLGLAIAKSLVEMHGGRIWVEGAVGKGSTFFLTLPVRQPMKSEEPAMA